MNGNDSPQNEKTLPLEDGGPDDILQEQSQWETSVQDEGGNEDPELLARAIDEAQAEFELEMQKKLELVPVPAIAGGLLFVLFGIPPVLGFLASMFLTYDAFAFYKAQVTGEGPEKGIFSFLGSSFLTSALVWAIVFYTHAGAFRLFDEEMIFASLGSFIGFLILYQLLYKKMPRMIFREAPSINPFPSALTMIPGYLLSVYALPLGPFFRGEMTENLDKAIPFILQAMFIFVTPFLFFRSWKSSFAEKRSLPRWLEFLLLGVVYFSFLILLYSLSDRGFSLVKYWQ